jgi:hypothetical protein
MIVSWQNKILTSQPAIYYYLKSSIKQMTSVCFATEIEIRHLSNGNRPHPDLFLRSE